MYTLPFASGMIFSVEYLEETIKTKQNKTPRINELKKVAGYKITLQAHLHFYRITMNIWK